MNCCNINFFYGWKLVKQKQIFFVFLAAILFAILVLIVYILCSPKEEIPPHYFFKVRQPLIMSKRAWELKKREEEKAKVIIWYINFYQQNIKTFCTQHFTLLNTPSQFYMQFLEHNKVFVFLFYFEVVLDYKTIIFVINVLSRYENLMKSVIIKQ